MSTEIATPSRALVDRAIRHIDATLLDDGRYAYRDDATARYWVVDKSDMLDLGRRLQRCDHPTCMTCGDTDCDEDGHNTYGDQEDERLVYSFWCADSGAEEMPLGWEPGVTIDDLVLCRSDAGDGGWSLHAPESTDDEIAEGTTDVILAGDAKQNEDGSWSRPTRADRERALQIWQDGG